MDYEKVLGERKFPTCEELKTGLLLLIDEGKISREDAARLLPELRESEDERVRKSIVATIEQCPDDFLNPKNRDRMLAYLEKQKEQKPAEWSEEDEKMIWNIVDVLEADNEENKKKFPYALSLHEQYKKMVDWLISLRPQPKPPVPLKDRYTPEERYQILLTLAEKVWGKKLSRFKTTDDTRIRMFVSYMMWMEGYSYEKIGKVMGRNHSSCINHVRRMRNVFDEPVFYAEENEKYNEFCDLVADHDEHRS